MEDKSFYAKDSGVQDQFKSDNDDAVTQNVSALISVKQEEFDQDNPEFTDSVGAVKLESMSVQAVKFESEYKPLLIGCDAIEESIKSEEFDIKWEKDTLDREVVKFESESKPLLEGCDEIEESLKPEEIDIKTEEDTPTM